MIKKIYWGSCACLIFFISACHNKYVPQKNVRSGNYVEQERLAGKHVYDFYWALSQNKVLQAARYTSQKGWKSVNKLVGNAVHDFSIQRIYLNGSKSAEVEVLVNRQKITKLLLTQTSHGWLIQDASLVHRAPNRKSTKPNPKASPNQKYDNKENVHLIQQKQINEQVINFYTALKNRDIATAEKHATSSGLQSIINLPIDNIDHYTIENIFLYGSIADVEVVINNDFEALTILVKKGGKWYINETSPAD